MDIYCTLCGEPWDLDSIHDAVAERFEKNGVGPWDVETKPEAEPWQIRRENGLYHNQKIYEKYFHQVKDEFVAKGCITLGGDGEWCKTHTKKNSYVTQMIYEIMGDDIDGAASMFEDAEDWGLLE